MYVRVSVYVCVRLCVFARVYVCVCTRVYVCVKVYVCAWMPHRLFSGMHGTGAGFAEAGMKMCCCLVDRVGMSIVPGLATMSHMHSSRAAWQTSACHDHLTVLELQSPSE
jgi:hypothetical protein